MMHKPDVHAILTSKNDLKLGSQFMDMFDRLQRVEVCSPTPLERLEFWQHFAQSHASFAQIDLERLAELSEGVSRHDLETAGRNAVRVAYQESLNTNEQDYLDIKDVLIELVPFMSAEQGSALMTIENVVAEAFMEELEGFTFEDKDPKSSEQ